MALGSAHSGMTGIAMGSDVWVGFGSAALKQLYGAFDTAWHSMKDSTDEADHETVREVIGKTIFCLARHGYSNPEHLATLAAYRAKTYIDLRV